MDKESVILKYAALIHDGLRPDVALVAEFAYLGILSLLYESAYTAAVMDLRKSA